MFEAEMKLRQKVEDFEVEEINAFDILKSGDFKLYLLEKKGLESFYIFGYLSKQNNIQFSEFGIAGLKDKHAITKQFFTIPSKDDIKTKNETNFKITFLGFVNKKIELGDLKGNRFKITARDIKERELKDIEERAKTIENGVPNYFDSQRFGSVSDSKFIIKFVMKKDYELAVKTFLTSTTKFENRKIKQEKQKILKNWNNLANIEINNKLFAKIIKEYKKTKSWLQAYKKIPYNLQLMFVSAYQSYLWNECVKEVLKETVGKEKLYSIKYNLGSLLYYKNLTNDELSKLPKTFTTISDKMDADVVEQKIINKILAKESLKIEDFDIKKETGNFFKASPRLFLAKPFDFNISKPQADELNRNKFKLTLSFSLPKGSYATIVTKRLFGQ